ncbi:macro domain-containing protein [Actinomadura bangladeshensis]|uniref:macro domain-containing protein n=1 Tax=Actinomadura bangladeshensis TaxID=453573 RepID=UPI00194173E9|nr:macro domain-containing protein [Actinomadura bangladeshensis]
MITERSGDLLRDDAQALVNPVNTVGVMGKGLALQFKRAFPAVFASYVEACADGRLRPGKASRPSGAGTGVLTGTPFTL